jgi:deazaflavin-dependent oxidoreductase (nitroreductase family)
MVREAYSVRIGADKTLKFVVLRMPLCTSETHRSRMHGAASVVERRTSPGLGRWRLFFRALFLTGPLFRFVRARRPMPPVEELVIPGRRTGAPRTVLLQLIEAPRGLYVIEPSGMPSQWADNLAAAGHATVLYADGRRIEVSATELDNCGERDAALDAQPTNQPAPMRVIYRRARRHVAAVGRVFRLELHATRPDTTAMSAAPAVVGSAARDINE